jgi:hypothetical protein
MRLAKWDYAVIPLKGDEGSQKKTLEMYGEQGWELVNIVETGVQLLAYFKRQKA